MMPRQVRLRVPDDAFAEIERRAKETHRPFGSVALDALLAGMRDAGTEGSARDQLAHLERVAWIAAMGVEQLLAVERAKLQAAGGEVNVAKWMGARRGEAANVVSERLRRPPELHDSEA
jgi:hypothetical protein